MDQNEKFRALSNEIDPLPNSSPATTASLRRNCMTAEESVEVMDHQHMLPTPCALAITLSPFLRWIPCDLSQHTFGAGLYNEDDRSFGRLLWLGARRSLQDSVKNDMNLPRGTSDAAAYLARACFFRVRFYQ